LKELGEFRASKMSVHWIDLFLGIEEALLILIVARLAQPRRRARVLFLRKELPSNERSHPNEAHDHKRKAS